MAAAILVSRRLTVSTTNSIGRLGLATLVVLGLLTAAESSRAETPVNPAPLVPAKVTCEMTSTSTIPNLKDYGFKDEEIPKATSGAGVSVTYPDLVLFQTYCYADKNVTTVVATDVIKFPACNMTSNVCKFYERVSTPAELTTTRMLVAEYLIQNKTDKIYQIQPTDLVVKISSPPTEAPAYVITPVFVSPKETPIYPPLNNAMCRVVVSGALDPIPEDVLNPEVRVSNGKLLFTATVTGLVGVGGSIESTTWTGGPDANGMWDKAPLGVVSQVEANVKVKSGQVVKCGIRVKPMGETFSIGMSRFGDCQFFGSARSYYHLDKYNKGFQNGGYSPPLQLLGLPVKYGESSADIPFRGVVNGAASLEGVINTGTGGDVVIPPASVRKYSGAIVIARSFDAATQKVSPAPIAWGLLDYSNYSVTQLQQLQNAGDDETVVFQVYLAASQIVDGVDIRGGASADSISLHDFRPGTADNKPFDRIVPLVNASCGAMTFPSPIRGDKAISPELAALKMCAFSKPHLLKDLKSGRISLDVMHVVPENAMHRFPPELVKTAAKPSCVAGTQNDAASNVSCWNVTAASIGINTNEEPFKLHSSCQTVKIVKTTTKVPSVGGYGGGSGSTTVTTSTPVTTYKASCNVIEQNECGPSTAIRFSGYNQMMLAGLGCAAKYDSTEQVSATLMNEGIIPYTSFGGSAPMHYEKYPASKVKFAAGDETKGFACIPCRFSGDAAKNNTTLELTTKTLPVDQDATGAARKPIYAFTKGSAPAECVKNVAFEVRYFGSNACDGVNAPAGHFCSSSNIAVQNCSTTDGGVGPGAFGGGGNVAGSFKVPVCPGSGIENDSVSVSWSPIIIDVTGNGISISREFQQARVFDIRGDGRGRVIDWPYNNTEVAFLVRPNKGKVTSIKELFGDYKAKNGFEALRKLDSNKDGMISKKDKAFAELSLWFDRNRNGKVDPGELESLEAHGIAELPLHYVKPNRKGVEGRTLSTVYFNHKHQRYMNIEDHYFYEYITNGRKMSQK